MALQRLFVALMLPPELALELVDLVAPVLKPAGRALRLCAAGDLHLTLLFLGDVAEAGRASLERELELGLAGARAPRFEVRGTGCFPPRGRPRVWWIGLRDAADAAGALHAAARQAAERSGVVELDPRDAQRPFRPHLTVARTRRGARPPAPELEEAFLALELEARWEPHAAALVESRPGAPEERYRVLRSYSLVT